jgi:predicted ATPase
MSKYIISGGPGAGKTTLLEALQQKGYACQEEVSRQLIKELVTSGSECLPWKDLACFAQLALQRMIADYKQASMHGDLTFFDRGIPDIIAYLTSAGLAIDETYYQAVRQYPYHSLVFMAPPWKDIYVNDTERWQTFEEALGLYQALVAAYQSLHFKVVELPRVSVQERLAFVETFLARQPKLSLNGAIRS